MDQQEIWIRTQEKLSSSLTRGVYSMWIKTAELSEIQELSENQCVAVIASITPFHLNTLENKFAEEIRLAIEEVTQKHFTLQFTLKRKGEEQQAPSHKKHTQPQSTLSLFPTEDVSTKTQTLEQEPQTPPTKKDIPPQTQRVQYPQYDSTRLAIQRAGLREDYTFETFAVSTGNEMAHAAAIAVSQNPGTAYNPLFLHGGVGVGKTHLMQAIGNNILRKNPDIAIAYITGEQFTNEIVAAIQQKRTIQLKNKFRNYRVLLMDDVQFIAGKVAVQEEFFHTFNAITPVGGQIILTSDRPPHEMTLLEDRLRSRFEAGLIVDIQQPTFELRTAILLIKAKKLALDLPMDLAQRIASAVESTRKLEGILAQLHSAGTLFHKPITLELVEEILGKTEHAEFPKQHIAPNEVIKAVATQFHIATNSLRGPSRIKHLVEARHIAMYILKTDLGITLEEIGHMFNGRDHTSVLHAVEKMEYVAKTHEDIRTAINAIKTSLSFHSTET